MNENKNLNRERHIGRKHFHVTFVFKRKLAVAALFCNGVGSWWEDEQKF